MPTSYEQLKSTLQSAQTSDDTRYQAWEAFHNSKSREEFYSAFKALDLPQETKRQLWFMKFPEAQAELQQQKSKAAPPAIPATPQTAAPQPKPVAATTKPAVVADPPKSEPSYLDRVGSFAKETASRVVDYLGAGAAAGSAAEKAATPLHTPTREEFEQIEAANARSAEMGQKPLIPISQLGPQRPEGRFQNFVAGALGRAEQFTTGPDLTIGALTAPLAPIKAVQVAGKILTLPMAAHGVGTLKEAADLEDSGKTDEAYRKAGEAAVDILPSAVWLHKGKAAPKAEKPNPKGSSSAKEKAGTAEPPRAVTGREQLALPPPQNSYREWREANFVRGESGHWAPRSGARGESFTDEALQAAYDKMIDAEIEAAYAPVEPIRKGPAKTARESAEVFAKEHPPVAKSAAESAEVFANTPEPPSAATEPARKGSPRTAQESAEVFAAQPVPKSAAESAEVFMNTPEPPKAKPEPAKKGLAHSAEESAEVLAREFPPANKSAAESAKVFMEEGHASPPSGGKGSPARPSTAEESARVFASEPPKSAAESAQVFADEGLLEVTDDVVRQALKDNGLDETPENMAELRDAMSASDPEDFLSPESAARFRNAKAEPPRPISDVEVEAPQVEADIPVEQPKPEAESPKPVERPMAEADIPVEQPKVETPKPAEAPRSQYQELADPNLAEVQPIKVADIAVDPVRFQFKSNVGEGGASDALRGSDWNKNLAGTIAVWKDPVDGKTYVVNGHHRVDLAKRHGVEHMNAVVIEAKDANEAKVIGALINIAEDKGNAIDAAKVLRSMDYDDSVLKKFGISPRGALAKQAMALRDLTPEVFNQVATGNMDLDHAAMVGRMIKKPEDQIAASNLLNRAARSGKRLTSTEVEDLVKRAQNAPKIVKEDENFNLFGNDEIEQNLAIETAIMSDGIRKQIAAEKRLFSSVGNEAAAEKLGKTGNTIKASDNAAAAQEAARALEIYNKLNTSAGPISQALNDGVIRIARGENENAVRKDTYESVRRAIAEVFQRGNGKNPESSPAPTQGGGNEGGPGSLPVRDVGPEQPGQPEVAPVEESPLFANSEQPPVSEQPSLISDAEPSKAEAAPVEPPKPIETAPAPLPPPKVEPAPKPVKSLLPPTPDRVRKIPRGANESVRIVFPSALDARVFDGTAKAADIAAGLGIPADVDMKRLSADYLKDVKRLANRLPKQAGGVEPKAEPPSFSDLYERYPEKYSASAKAEIEAARAEKASGAAAGAEPPKSTAMLSRARDEEANLDFFTVADESTSNANAKLHEERLLKDRLTAEFSSPLNRSNQKQKLKKAEPPKQLDIFSEPPKDTRPRGLFDDQPTMPDEPYMKTDKNGQGALFLKGFDTKIEPGMSSVDVAKSVRSRVYPARGEQTARMYMNAPAREAVQAVYRNLFGRDLVFQGAYMEPRELVKIGEFMANPDMQFHGVEARDMRNIRELGRSLVEMAKDPRGGTMVVANGKSIGEVKAIARHEQTHVATESRYNHRTIDLFDYRNELGFGRKESGFTALADKAMRSLRQIGYGNESGNMLVREMITFISSGTHDQLGLNSDEAFELLAGIMKRTVEAHGEKAREILVNAQPGVRKEIERRIPVRGGAGKGPGEPKEASGRVPEGRRAGDAKGIRSTVSEPPK